MVAVVPKLSGENCVERLIQLGFRVSHRASGLTALRRGARFVVIPDVATVDPQMLDAIVRSAGVGPEFFADGRASDPRERPEGGPPSSR